jgi:hypothetical protein
MRRAQHTRQFGGAEVPLALLASRGYQLAEDLWRMVLRTENQALTTNH